MTRAFSRQLLSIELSFLLVVTALPFEAGGQQTPTGSAGYSGQGAPLSASELQQLAAPIALYPDALVAQILGAATFPDQIAAANTFLQQNQSLTGQTLINVVDVQPWESTRRAPRSTSCPPAQRSLKNRFQSTASQSSDWPCS